MKEDYELRAGPQRGTECERFDERLSDYLEDTLDRRARAEMEAHASACTRCSAILEDIAGIRAEAGVLPQLVPSRDLWQGIAARIQPSVVPLQPRAAQRYSRRWIAVAASILVIAGTAAVTYLATSRAIQRPAAVAGIATPPAVVTAPAEEPTGPRDSTPAIAPTPQGGSPAITGREPRSVVASAPRRPSDAQATARNVARSLSATEVAYGDEIERLQKVIATRRKQLDPATVSVIEENLKVIDAALKKSRDALARDPASGLLTDQLKTVLDKKVELLRTVALLPSRT